MDTTIYLIRHGESLGNLQGLFLGQTDLDLTERGYAQAERTAAFLKNVAVDRIYSSDLKRAFHTAECTARLKNIEIITDVALREIFAGEWEGKAFVRLEQDYASDYTVWQKNIGLSQPTGGESVKALQMRFLSAVQRLAKENKGKSICIFTHATPIRTLKAALDGRADNEISQIPWPTNASVTVCHYRNGRLQMEQYSRDDFMAELSTALPANV